jgi:protocatechuate 3,4-dioxygenase beta subunit
VAATRDYGAFHHFLEANLNYFNRRIALFAITLIAGVAASYAQSTATLSGRVTDPSGAVVPQARVTVSGLATGVDRVVTSDAEGNYTIPSLQPGNYGVSVQATGFSNYKLAV